MRSSLAPALVLAAAVVASWAAAAPADARPSRRAARVGKRAFDTIQQAIDAALPGERVVVGRRVFAERLVISKSIALVGRRTVLDGAIGATTGPCITIAADDVTIQGVTFRNGTDQIAGDGDGLRVVKCAFVNAGESAVDVTGDGVSVESSTCFGAAEVAVIVRGITGRVSRSSFRNLSAGAIALRGDDATVERCSVRASSGGAAIDVVGDRATVTRTSVVGGTGDLVAIDGESALVERCELVGSANGDAVDVLGNRAEVVRCFASSAAFGISVRGDEAIVEGNDVRYVSRAGVSVVGDVPQVRSNLVLFALGDDAAIVVDRAGGTGGGTVEANAAEDCAAGGIRLAGPGVTASGNDVRRCGSPDDAAVLVDGSDCTVEGGAVLDAGGNAIVLSGDRCRAVEAFAGDAARDAFLVLGDSCRLTAVVARRCGGEGVENGGAGTVVEGSTFLGNRIDVAIRPGIPFGTFAPDNRFETGGPSVPAEIP